MLQNVENARVIRGKGRKGDAKELVGLSVVEPAQLRARLFMRHFIQYAVQLRDLSGTGDLKPVDALAGVQHLCSSVITVRTLLITVSHDFAHSSRNG